MMQGYDQVILVDSDDRETGVMEKMEAHRKGLLHRAFSVIVFNDEGQMLLQQRALSKYHSAGLWSNTCCSHPRPGEETHAAANRRLLEEMGFECELKEIFTFRYRAELENGLTEHEIDHVYLGNYNGIPEINAEEADAWRYADLEELTADAAANPDHYTYWFKVLLKELTVRDLI
ncbi:isopentenyl-diphosphate Delta-isomerase [Mucilaginibacter terrenus]|nr:isopentenyl-diphosphate Delta-isomerase [Mucilaginibacter terrenus]